MALLKSVEQLFIAIIDAHQLLLPVPVVPFDWLVKLMSMFVVCFEKTALILTLKLHRPMDTSDYQQTC